MKKIIGLAILLMMSFAMFAKDIPLKVIETEWGFLISNLNAKGKRNCTGTFYYDVENEENLSFVFKSKNDSFVISRFAEIFIKDKALGYVLSDDGTYLPEKSKGNLPISNLANTDQILVVFTDGKYQKCSAYSDGKNLHLSLSDYSKDCESKLSEIVEELKKRNAEEAEKKKAIENNWVYDHMPWGTSVLEVLGAHPDAKEIEREGVVERYTRKGSSGNDMVYKFYEGKLVGGVTTFYMSDEAGVNELNQRMKELYGEPNDVKETSEHHVENINFLGNHRIAYTERHVKVNWKKSPTFNILLDVCLLDGDTKKDIQNICLFITTHLVKHIITYENPSMVKQIAESNAKFKKEQEEAKKAKDEAEKRDRMNNLDL